MERILWKSIKDFDIYRADLSRKSVISFKNFKLKNFHTRPHSYSPPVLK